jgi:phosphoribosyl-AMP cyclohydrolase
MFPSDQPISKHVTPEHVSAGHIARSPVYTATPIDFDDNDLDVVEFDGNGLVPAVIQDASDGTVLMLGYMNRESLRRTLTSGRTCFWSRSRQEYWVKGETSGDRQWVREVRYDCDGDTLLVLVDQEGRGACHTGERSCFYRSFGHK